MSANSATSWSQNAANMCGDWDKDPSRKPSRVVVWMMGEIWNVNVHRNRHIRSARSTMSARTTSGKWCAIAAWESHSQASGTSCRCRLSYVVKMVASGCGNDRRTGASKAVGPVARARCMLLFCTRAIRAETL